MKIKMQTKLRRKYYNKMDTTKLPSAQDVCEKDLTDASYWKPIYEEMMKLQEQRNITRGLVIAR